jgi:hypothetical protein
VVSIIVVRKEEREGDVWVLAVRRGDREGIMVGRWWDLGGVKKEENVEKRDEEACLYCVGD